MIKTGQQSPSGAKQSGGLFNVLGAYKGIVSVLILIALAGSGTNLLISRIIARAIDAFSAHEFHAGTVIMEFLAAVTGILLFTFLQSVLQTLTAERVARDMRNRISRLLSLESNLRILESKCPPPGAGLSQVQHFPGHPHIQFKNVSFTYPNGREVLHQTNFSLQRGKTYAFVGHTGGGKTTTASLVAHRLNTIENADDIFFVNSGRITRAGSFSEALEMLMHGKTEG